LAGVAAVDHLLRPETAAAAAAAGQAAARLEREQQGRETTAAKAKHRLVARAAGQGQSAKQHPTIQLAERAVSA
jgi:hypothetical protein